MKEQILKWIKRYGVTVWLIAAILALAASLSYAAYVNLDIDKWVLSTGKGNQAFFGSNYLYLTDRKDEVYSERRIARPAENNGTYSFTVQVCNYVYGNPDMVNLDNITYTFQVKLLPNGGELPENRSGINVTFDGTTKDFSSGDTISFDQATLTGGAEDSDSYQFTVPSELADFVRFQVVAEPSILSYSATNHQKLAAVLTLADPKNVNSWTGRFIDEKDSSPSAYSGFNYEISGTGEGTLTLTWDKSLQISPWFLKDNDSPEQQTVTGTDGRGKWQITMSVGGKYADGTGKPSAYQFQFYKVDKAAIDDHDWTALENLVTVSFTEKTS